jgi:hypothetical protein
MSLGMRRDTDGTWPVPDYEPRSDYQSWCGQYPTYEDLAKAAGAT